MSENKVFCEECRDDVSYTIEETEMTGTIMGIKCIYTGKVARCAECGAYVDADDITDYNLEAIYNVYRSKRNKR